MIERTFLSNEELKELTGRVRKSAQQAALRMMSIEHKVRPDGALVVSRSHVEKMLHGEVGGRQKLIEPNWSGV